MEQYIEQLKPLFSQVAEKIGQGAEFGWEVVLRQQFAYGFVALFWALLGLVGMIAVYKICNKYGDWETDEWVWVMSIFGGGLFLVSFIVGAINAILYLSNPQYYALQFFI